LDPLETLSGQQQRLNNLGYFAGFVEPEDPKSPNSQFRWAVEEFQCDHMGPSKVDGVLGPQTLAKLKEVYGC
jgi:peptidoglycan hydrolase-like protein with peptidoglycan-binding domain